MQVGGVDGKANLVARRKASQALRPKMGLDGGVTQPNMGVGLPAHGLDHLKDSLQDQIGFLSTSLAAGSLPQSKVALTCSGGGYDR